LSWRWRRCSYRGEVDEGLGVLAEDVRGGQGGVDLGMIDVDVRGWFEVSEREHAVFDAADTIEAPLPDHWCFSLGLHFGDKA
jgi:hypothetical protein